MHLVYFDATNRKSESTTLLGTCARGKTGKSFLKNNLAVIKIQAIFRDVDSCFVKVMRPFRFT